MIMEYLVSLFISMMLLGSSIMLIMTGTRDYIYEIGDWDMLSEVRMSLEQIADKVRYGNVIICDNDNMTIIFYDKEKEIISRERYYLKNNNVGHIFHKHYNGSSNTAIGQPLTGNTFIGWVFIKKLKFTKCDEYTLKIEIEGVNKVSGHSVSLETDIFCYGEFMAER